MNKIEKIAFDYLVDARGGYTKNRLEKLSTVIKNIKKIELGKLRLEICSDEKTGCRYGLAKCRVGRSAKIGRGGANRGNWSPYQLWAVWN